ncbi:MAG TPA: hypothetical protein VLE97_11685 [Gaiellaceae bacterium]|nr:hypothetical protein [Gaiellaceae bacterium]
MTRKKTPRQLDREIASALARRPSTHAHAKRRGPESPSAWMSKAAGIIVDDVRASDAYRNGREEVLRSAVEQIGPSPSVERLRELGGLTEIVKRQIAQATTRGLDDNLGSPMFPHTARRQLAREIAPLRTEVQMRIARSHATRKVSDDNGTFYLTDGHERPLGAEFATRAAAKRAALKIVREKIHPRIEVWHRWRGDRYMQGLASEEGWSDV